MSSQNILKPINCNVQDINVSARLEHVKNFFSKRSRIDNNTKNENKSTRWSLSNRNELQSLAEMGLGMLDSDELSDTYNDCQPSCSRVDYELNDTNPEFINLPGESISNSSSNESDECTNNNEIDKKEDKKWDEFCLYRRASIMNKDMKDWFTELSDEIILMVFKWLPKVSLVNCALVCKRWYELTTDETLWTRLDVSSNSLTPGSVGHILSRQVLVLRMAQSEILDPPILPNVKAFSDDFEAKLMYLDLSMATISTEGLSILLSKCNRLKKVSLEACVVDSNVCVQLAKNRYLEVLNMSNVEGLNEEGVEPLLKSCTCLKELNIAWTLLSISCLDIICSKMPSGLSRLNISGCRKTLNNTHVKKLVNRCPRLTELDLSDCTALTNEVIRDIIQLTKLNFLALSRCYAIQCAGLMRLTHCKSLTYLDIHGGHIEQRDINEVQKVLGNGVQLNKFLFSSVARPTVGMKRSSIWGLRVRD